MFCHIHRLHELKGTDLIIPAQMHIVVHLLSSQSHHFITLILCMFIQDPGSTITLCEEIWSKSMGSQILLVFGQDHFPASIVDVLIHTDFWAVQAASHHFDRADLLLKPREGVVVAWFVQLEVPLVVNVLKHHPGLSSSDSHGLGADNPDFTQIGFNDRTKSMRVTGGEPWVVFEHINYKGDFKLYKPGDYNSLPGFEEKISSVKVVRGGLDGPEIRVFEHINYKGDFKLYKPGDYNSLPGFEEKISSVKVVRGGLDGPEIRVFEHINYKGDFKLYKPGDYNSLPGFEEKISSVKVVRGGLDGPEIRVYEHINYGGREVILTKNQENLGSHGLNDQISSHKVMIGAWILYEHAQYQGNKMVALAGEEVDNYGHLGWNDKVSSLQLM
uniref:Beta/gamma crystallin 'Greek key' domain-containing protein n=1 Tax=Leptobrachium leishanense TaxID=445787 RepID=A0A8C5MGP8_9ANUR